MTELERKLTDIVADQSSQLKQLLSQNETLTAELSIMKQKLDYLLKKLYGSSSEKTKIGPGQMSIFDGDDSFLTMQRQLKNKPMKSTKK